MVNYLYYTLNPKEMRVNACDVRVVVCVPTLNGCCKEQCEFCKGLCLFQENFVVQFEFKNQIMKN